MPDSTDKKCDYNIHLLEKLLAVLLDIKVNLYQNTINILISEEIILKKVKKW